MMRLIVLLFLFCSAYVHAGNQSPEHSIILADGPIDIQLKDSVQWLKADYNSMSLGQLQLATTPIFKNLQSSPIMQSQDTYWIRFHIINPFPVSLPMALNLSNKTITVQGTYSLTGKRWQRISGFEKEQHLTGHTALIFNFQANTDQWIYLRIRSLQTSKLEPTLQNLNQYTHSLSFLQQILGAMMALMAFIALLHISAIRFHNHARHYLVGYLALVGFLYGMAHLPLASWPNWLNKISTLTPWLLACGLWLSSFSNDIYHTQLKSNRTSMVILVLLLISLMLFNLGYSAVLLTSILPCLVLLSRYKDIHNNLFLSGLILLGFISWQLCYSYWPAQVPSPSGMINIYITTACIVFASMGMLLPYFQRQSKRNEPINKSRNNAFLSHLSHELRSPMNGVLGMSELLNETPLSHTQRDYVDTIQTAGQDILRMIDRISDYAKITSGRMQLEDTQVDLALLVEKTLNRFQYTANQKNIELVLNVSPDIPEFIKIDERRLHTIIDYLLENALHHTEHGEVELRIKWDSQSNQQQLLFSIHDTGSGMRKETLKTLFSSIEQLDNAKSDFQLNSIAMTLCKQLVALMGGDMYVESTLGLGSTFSFSLPYRFADQIEEKQSPIELLQGLSVLIVDDNSTLRKVIQRYAKSWGMHADATYSGKEALALLRNQANLKTPYDIVLIDQDMPIMDGFQLAKRIQEDEEINQNLIKVMLTGLVISSKHKDVVQAGIHQVISKPVSARALQQVLAQRIQQKIVMKSAYT